jgi:UDP-N-acetylglucosamine:LPS N-acetylglucosamine transferase
MTPGREPGGSSRGHAPTARRPRARRIRFRRRLAGAPHGRSAARPRLPRSGADDAAAPRRALIVSANIGEGHNATGRALDETIRQIWPDCEVRWLDVLDAMGPGIGPLVRYFYVMQVERTPWIYEFFFDAIWRYRWFLQWSKRLMGSWCGRVMAPTVRRYDPDLIISTYPLGAAGLAWLRHQGRLDAPVGSWVSDFCPHPFWMYRNIDVTYVVDETAVPVAEGTEPDTDIRVGALAVTSKFEPADRAEARLRLGVSHRSFVALITTGSLGFGRSDEAVRALLAAHPDVEVVAICGRNDQRRRELEQCGFPEERLRVIGWTDDMPGWITAADVVLANGGGVTVLEALACGRPVIMFDPIAGHGKTNASLMAKSGAGLLCGSPAELTEAVRELVTDPDARIRLEKKDAEAAANRWKEDDLRDLASVRVSPR